MGKKNASSAASSKHSHLRLAASLTLREESSGKKHGNLNVKSMLKLDHIKSLANWASGEACIPPLGAFFGHRLTAISESLCVPLDPSLFSCQKFGLRRLKQRSSEGRDFPPKILWLTSAISVHQNLKRGTPKGYMKGLCTPKAKPPSKSDLSNCTPVKCSESEVKVISKDDPMSKNDEIASLEITGNDPAVGYPTTPLMKAATLLDMGKRKRSWSRSKKAVESESSSVVVDSGKPSFTSSKQQQLSFYLTT